MAIKGLEQVSKDEPITIGDFTLVHNSTTNNLEFRYNGSVVMEMDENGNLGR